MASSVPPLAKQPKIASVSLFVRPSLSLCLRPSVCLVLCLFIRAMCLRDEEGEEEVDEEE